MPRSPRRTKPCLTCGVEMSVKASHFERRKTCSKECDAERRKSMYEGENNPNYGNRGPKNPMFKGGRLISDGYVYLYMPDHPMSTKGGYIREHRFVMSEYLGRPLRDDEDVHHIDGDRLNNDISNLQVLSRSEHTKLHNAEKEIIRNKDTGRIMAVFKAGVEQNDGLLRKLAKE